MNIDESTIDKEPSKRSLAAALHAVDNMQALVNLMATNSQRRAAACNIGRSEDGRVTFYVTASDNVDEEKLARTIAAAISGMWSEATASVNRAAVVRLVVAQQWAVAMAINNDPATWPTHAVEALMLPCADDVVAEALGER